MSKNMNDIMQNRKTMMFTVFQTEKLEISNNIEGVSKHPKNVWNIAKV